MNICQNMRVRARVIDIVPFRGGHVQRRARKFQNEWSPWKNNMVLDQGLNSFAQKSGGIGVSIPANSFQYCEAGSGSNSNSIAGGSTTFTQVGTTITATASFFTPAMVGAIIKYGATGTTNGAEQYIVSQTGVACVVSGAGMTVAIATAATVHLVNQTGLQTYIYNTNTYQTSGTSNGSTFSANQVTHQRTFNFAVQGSTINVNEIGWSPINSSTLTMGRLVLGTTLTVSSTQFLQVQLQLIGVYTPASPTTVTNVGTGINTAGNIALETLQVGTVSSAGTTSGVNGIDGSTVTFCMRIGSTYSQNASPSPSGTFLSWAGNILVSVTTATWTYTASSVGIMTVSFSTSTFNTTGQTCYAFGLCLNTGSTSVFADLLFTTPFALPTGTYQPNPVWQMIFNRTLTNL